jgi:hypothetical protein
MKMYGVNLAEGSEIVNLSVALGTSYPSNPNAGELFFRTDSPNVGLYIHDGTAWAQVQTSASSGTVTSVAVTGGATGLTTSGGPITSSGTITIGGTLSIGYGGTGQTTANAAFNALVPAQTGENGKVLVTNGTDTFWSYQTTTLTGDVTGSGMSSFITTLATVNSNVGGFGSATKASTFTVNAKGLVIAAGEVTVTPAWSSITSTPTTLSGYGITDAATDTTVVHLAGIETITGSKTFSVPVVSSVSSGTAPFTIASTTMVNNLNVNYLNGFSYLYFLDASNFSAGTLNAARLPAFTGDATSTAGSSNLTLATVNSNVGSFGGSTQSSSITVNAKGLITAASNTTITPAWSSITSTPTTLSGYGITDAQPLDADLTAIAALTGTVGLLHTNGAGTWTVDTATYLTGNQTITISGDTTGSGTTAITTTLATVNSNVGSFASATQVGTFTVNAKGLITAASNVTVTPAWSSITSTPTTLSGYGITDAAPISHVSDFSLHLTSGQNTLIDAITATATEINYTVGVTSSIQTQLDAKVAKAGSSMNSTANITFSGGGEVLGLPTTPSGATSATSKAYVDALTSASATWRNPIVDPDLYDIVSAEPGSPVLGTTYITTTAGTWTGSVSVSVGSVVTYLATGAGWLVIKTLASGDRFLVTGEHGTGVGSTLGAFVISTHTVEHNDLVQYNGGTITSSASWTLPEGFAGGSPTITQGVTVLDNASNSEHLGHTYLYNATSNVWVEIAGPGAVGAGTGLSYSGNVLNVNLGAGIVQLPTDEVGIDVYSTGGIMTTVNGTTSSTLTNAQLALTEVGTAGTYKSVTTDSKGRVTAGTNPTTLSGYGITDAQPLDADLTAIAALTGTSGFLKTNGSGTWTVDTATYLTGNQSITLSGDFTGTGTTAITGTLVTVNSNVGTFGSATQASVVTVNAKGLVTAASNVTVTPAWGSITSTPTTLSGYGITDAALDSTVVHLAGTETITGTKTFTATSLTATSTNVNFTGSGIKLNMGAIGTANTATIQFHTGATAAANYDSNIVATGGNGTDGQGSLNFNSFSTTVTGNLFWVYARTFLEPAGTSDAFTVSGSMGDNTGTTTLINATDTHTIVTATSGNSLTVNTYASNIRFSTNPIANAVHFVANDPTLLSGATLTSQSGFAANLSVGGTHNYGFYGNVTAAAGNYNFYTATTAANLFTGPTTFTGTVVVPTPAADNQAATKNYADTIAMAMAIVFG